jgi:hypothetical protein
MMGSGGAPGGDSGAFSGGSSGGMGGFGEAGAGTGGPQGGTAVLWTYRRPKGVTYEFLINEDGLVAQIALTGQADAHRTGRGVGLGSDFKTVMLRYGQPTQYLITGVAQSGVQQVSVSQAALLKSGGQVTQIFYPKSHHAAFTFLANRAVRVVIALAE